MYSLECEAAVNEQFLQGLKCGRQRSREMLMEYQVLGQWVSSEKRGGMVQLKPMVIPQSEFDYADTGDVLMLSMVKLFLISQV
uniref:Uncharacterized protein n=1 Tax=Brassica oleracea TaxID=3712 RepID=A0A3P6BXB1_BRAOL|nr:unnamed protein product [Brassica oleracea]